MNPLAKLVSCLDIIALARAANLRDPELFRGDGYILIYDGKVFGWTRYLDRPADVCPGAYAVNAELMVRLDVHRGVVSIFEAKGGNCVNGAQRWERIN